MTEQEALFAKFYSQEKLLIPELDAAGRLTEYRRELEEVCLKAKAKLQAVRDFDKEKRDKLHPKQREWTITPHETDQVTSDAINAVESRKKRLSKLDKLEEQLKAAGISDDIRKQMLSNLQAAATDQTLQNVTFKPKPMINVRAEAVSDKSDNKPIDLKSLKFGKK